MDSTLLVHAGIEPRSAEPFALAVRCSITTETSSTIRVDLVFAHSPKFLWVSTVVAVFITFENFLLWKVIGPGTSITLLNFTVTVQHVVTIYMYTFCCTVCMYNTRIGATRLFTCRLCILSIQQRKERCITYNIVFIWNAKQLYLLLSYLLFLK